MICFVCLSLPGCRLRRGRGCLLSCTTRTWHNDIGRAEELKYGRNKWLIPQLPKEGKSPLPINASVLFLLYKIMSFMKRLLNWCGAEDKATSFYVRIKVSSAGRRHSWSQPPGEGTGYRNGKRDPAGAGTRPLSSKGGKKSGVRGASTPVHQSWRASGQGWLAAACGHRTAFLLFAEH